MQKPEILFLLLALICLNPLSKAQSTSSDHAALPTDQGDPVLTEEMVSDLPFVKPTMTMQKALRIAEASLGKDVIDRKHYFLIEARMIDPKNGPAFNWHFKWIRWGVRQHDNTPLEVTVTSEGKVVKNGFRAK